MIRITALAAVPVIAALFASAGCGRGENLADEHCETARGYSSLGRLGSLGLGSRL